MNKPRPVHLDIQGHRKNFYGIVRSSFRRAGKVLHTLHGRITGMSKAQLKLIQAAFQEEVVPKDSPHAIRI